MRKVSVAITLLLALLSPLVAGTASASPADRIGSAATGGVSPMARHLVCAVDLTLRHWPGGPRTGDVLHWGDLVETLQWDGAWVLVDPIVPNFNPGWVVGRYIC